MLAILVSILAACGGVLASIPLTLEVEEMFELFVQKHNRDYAADHERQARFLIFKKNVEEAIRMNEEINDTVFGISPFMDLTTEEFTSKYACFRPNDIYADNCNLLTDKDIPTVDAPESFDWREHQAVTRVKNQGYCGSCWAFSTIGNVESMNAIKNKKLVEFSEQQLVDCDDSSGRCAGGEMYDALSYLVQAGGAMTEADYPYAAQNQSCAFDNSKVKVKLSGCNHYNLTSQEKLKQLVFQNGPVTISLDAQSLQPYYGSILPASLCKYEDIDHALLLVGYGVENGKQYWLIKNSWGHNYGYGGYLKIERGEHTNACGIMNGDGINTAIIEKSSGGFNE